MLCTGKKCAKRGALTALAHLQRIEGDTRAAVQLSTKCSGCQGLCGKAPVMRVKVGGAKGPGQLYEGVNSAAGVEEGLAYSLLLAKQQPTVEVAAPVLLD